MECPLEDESSPRDCYGDFELAPSKEHELPHTSYYVCELFDSKTWSWNHLPDVVVAGSCIIPSVAVYASDSAHWLRPNHTGLPFPHQDTSIIAVPPDSFVYSKVIRRKACANAASGGKGFATASVEGFSGEFQAPDKDYLTELWVYDNGVWTT